MCVIMECRNVVGFFIVYIITDFVHLDQCIVIPSMSLIEAVYCPLLEK